MTYANAKPNNSVYTLQMNTAVTPHSFNNDTQIRVNTFQVPNNTC